MEDQLGRNGICSNYSFAHVDYTWETIRRFRGGTAIFTQPNTPVKCGGAPQKIMYQAEHAFRKQGVRDAAKVVFASHGKVIFGVEKYAATLNKIVRERGIETAFPHDLTEIRVE